MDILVFFAHPDDETMLFGGTLALLARLGARVHYLCATRGEGGEMGEPPLCEREALGRVREAELQCAVQALGGVSLDFLDYIDPTVGPDDTLYPYASELEVLAGQVVSAVRDYNASVLITHGSNGEYGHPGHLHTYQAAVRAVQLLGAAAPLLYSGQGAFADSPKPHLLNKDDQAHLVIDVSGVREQKVQAALCHRTQHALFVRRASEEAGRLLAVPEVIVTLESLHRVYPTVELAPVDPEGWPTEHMVDEASEGSLPGGVDPVRHHLDDPLARLLIGSGTAKALV